MKCLDARQLMSSYLDSAVARDEMSAIGSPPAAARGANFPTGYFARRQEALDWLGS